MSGTRHSFWGWGLADRFPAESARVAIGKHAASLTGLSLTLDPERCPTLDTIELPAARKVAIPTSLSSIAHQDAYARASHTYGKSYRDLVRGLKGDFRRAPDVVLQARNEEDIVRVLDWAADQRLAVIPYGGGTSVVGGVEADLGERSDAFTGVVSLDLRGLDRVLEVDPISRAARIQAGATGPVLEAQLKAHGLTLRHYPQSFEFSTLGGWIATRAGGHFATLATHIDDLVESTRAVTPQGILESRRLPGSGAGPSPDRLMLGSEGALGIITEAWMRVRRRPTFRASASVRFSDFQQGVLATRAIAQSGLHPANCRLLDATEAALNQVSRDGSNVLVLGFESDDHDVLPWLERALALAREAGGVHGEVRGGQKRDGAESSWRQAFLAMPYLMNALVSLGLVVDTFETACTWDRFEALDRAIRAQVGDTMRRHCGGGSLSCRFTHVYPDGVAPYYTFIAQGRSGAELEQWAAIKQSASDTILAHGGTITHHHAVGRVHREHYRQQRPPLFGQALGAVKTTLDPQGLLNPGVLL